jgi:hypothetical protein
MLALLLALSGCGRASPTTPRAVAKAGPTIRTVGDVRRSFSSQGIRLDDVPNPSGPPQPVDLTAVTNSSANLPAKPPYAAQAAPIGVDVVVYPTIQAARVGSETVSTVGNAGPMHSYLVRNVLVRWQGYGRAPTVAAAVRALR